MSSIAGLALSRSSGAWNQLQQKLGDNLSAESLQGVTRQLEGQFPQMVNEAFPNRDNNPPVASPPTPQPGIATLTPTLAYPGYYGYGRPLPTGHNTPAPIIGWAPAPALATAGGVPSLAPGPMMSQPVGYVAPSGYTGHAPAQTGPAPYQWYS